MAQQKTLPDTSDERDAKLETDNLYKELEPDANEIMFGQKTLPNRPLTMKETSKRKKILLKLVDQRLKFKLIELMGREVVSKQNKQAIETVTTIPNVNQTMNTLQPSYSFSSYQPNWFPHSDLHQHAEEGNWPQHYQSEWQLSSYSPQYGTVWNGMDVSWNSFQTNHSQGEIQSNVQHFRQHLKANKPLKRKIEQNPNLIVASELKNVARNDNKISTKTSVNVPGNPNEKFAAACSSLISVRTKLFEFFLLVII